MQMQKNIYAIKKMVHLPDYLPSGFTGLDISSTISKDKKVSSFHATTQLLFSNSV